VEARHGRFVAADRPGAGFEVGAWLPRR
jgi:hypothetical protein